MNIPYCKCSISEIRSIDVDDLSIGEAIYLRGRYGIDKYIVCRDYQAKDDGRTVLVFSGDTHICALLQVSDGEYRNLKDML